MNAIMSYLHDCPHVGIMLAIAWLWAARFLRFRRDDAK
jgi:hypothetical protein